MQATGRARARCGRQGQRHGGDRLLRRRLDPAPRVSRHRQVPAPRRTRRSGRPIRVRAGRDRRIEPRATRSPRSTRRRSHAQASHDVATPRHRRTGGERQQARSRDPRDTRLSSSVASASSPQRANQVAHADARWPARGIDGRGDRQRKMTPRAVDARHQHARPRRSRPARRRRARSTTAARSDTHRAMRARAPRGSRAGPPATSHPSGSTNARRQAPRRRNRRCRAACRSIRRHPATRITDAPDSETVRAARAGTD